MRDVVRVEVPGMQVGRLVPLRNDIGARTLASLDDRPRIRAVVGVDIDDAIAACLRQDGLNVSNTFLAVASGPTVLSVKDATTDSVLVTSPSLTLASGNPYTIWITGTKALNNLTINVLQAQY